MLVLLQVVGEDMPECPEVLVLIVPVLIKWRFTLSYFFSLPSMPRRVGGGGRYHLGSNVPRVETFSVPYG